MSSRAKLAVVTMLTLGRFPLVLLFFGGAIAYSLLPPAERPSWLFATTFAALVTSAVTDLFDGILARRFKVETKLGAHADPLMDKFFYVATLPILVFVAARNDHTLHAVILLFMTMFFLTRDQWVSFLRSIGASYNIPGGANWSGKLRTSINFPLICCIYHFEASPTPFLSTWFIYSFETIGIVVNLVSIVVYTRRYWDCLRASASTETR